jgi:DNA (cytosine-5)-methyltransferase 1
VLTHIDLFSGIGGFALAAEWTGFKTIVFCEKDKWCQQVLKKHWPRILCVEDIKEFDGKAFRGATLLTGGFPCTPFSIAGKRRGKEDDRYLWPEMFRVIKESRPTWVIGENVTGIVRMELDTTLSDLEGEGYSTQTFIIPACGVEAPHKRDRVWILGHSESGRLKELRKCESKKKTRTGPECSGDVEDSSRERWRGRSNGDATGDEGTLQVERPSTPEESTHVADSEIDNKRSGLCDKGQKREWRYESSNSGCIGNPSIWLPESNVCRVVNGLPNRVDRLRGLGNAIVPQISAEIMRNIFLIENMHD